MDVVLLILGPLHCELCYDRTNNAAVVAAAATADDDDDDDDDEANDADDKTLAPATTST